MIKRTKTGFTLVEIITILVVIALLILFSSLSIPTILARARDAKRKADIRRVSQAIEEYREDTDCYPKAIPLCENKLEEDGFTLLSNIPCDPETKNSYVYVSEGSQCPSWFQLYGNLEYTKDTIIDRVGCREGCGPDCQFNYGVASTNQKLDPYCGEDPDEEIPPDQYVCAPSGACEIFEDPEISGCPDIYPNDPTCQDECSSRENRCHDERGKLVPD